MAIFHGPDQHNGAEFFLAKYNYLNKWLCTWLNLYVLISPIYFLDKNNAFYGQHTILLTHWGRVTHICVDKLTVIGSDNDLPPGRRQAIIWTNAAILSIGSLGTNYSEISIEIHTFSFKKMHLKMASAKWRLFCLGLSVLIEHCWGNGTDHGPSYLLSAGEPIMNRFWGHWSETMP